MQSVLSTWDDPCVDAGIEAHQHPLMMHSEGQQINVCDLAMGHHLITTNGGRRRPGERIGPEPMVGMRQQSDCLLYTSPSPRDTERSRMPSSA